MAMGQGLGALISDTGVAQENPTVVELKIIEVEPNKNQPRTNFDDEKLEDLAASIPHRACRWQSSFLAPTATPGGRDAAYGSGHDCS